MVVALLACAGPAHDTAADTGGAVPTMEASAWLTRASLDLRGRRPSLDELEQVGDDQDAAGALIDGFVDDEAFGERIRDLFSRIYRTRTERFVDASLLGLSDNERWQAALGDEPLRLLSHIATEELPYTELVTSELVMVDDQLAQVWPVDVLPTEDEGWVEGRWTDGRPAVGVIGSNTLWLRYPAAPNNRNRGRANAISRILLCDDYLGRDVVFEDAVGMGDDALEDAVRTQASCTSCHAGLDPLASYLYGFGYLVADAIDERTVYHPEREEDWRAATGVPPAYFGVPGNSLADLGTSIAADPRFPDCATEQVYELLLGRPVDFDDTRALQRHRAAFLDDLTMKRLVRSVVTEPRYRAGATEADGYVPVKLATAHVLAGQVEDLTGYRWAWGDQDVLRSHRSGLAVLGGEADGLSVLTPAERPTPAMVLVQQRLAEIAAARAIDADEQALEAGAETTLLDLVTLDADLASDPDGVTAQIERLHHRFFGREVAEGDPELDALVTLWGELHAANDGDTVPTWIGLVTAMLRDPDLLLY